MSIVVNDDIRVLPDKPSNQQELMVEVRLNLVALEYGYRYRLDIRAKNGMARVEFLRILQEARCVAISVRRAGGLVQVFKICEDGTLKRHTR